MKKIILFQKLKKFFGKYLSKKRPLNNNDKALKAALTKLCKNPHGEFVIASEVSSDKFIQFAGSKHESLKVDLPIQTLSSDEIERAVSLFQEYGVSHERSVLLDEPGGKPIGIQAGFHLDVQNNIALAVEIAMRVFKEVYLFQSNFELELEVV